MPTNIRVALIDHDFIFGQKLATELAVDGLHVDIAPTESKLFDLLHTTHVRHEVVLVGLIGDLQRKMKMLFNIHNHFPNIGIISLADTADELRTDGQPELFTIYSVDRMANSKVIASWIQLITQYQSEHQRNHRLQALVSVVMRAGYVKGVKNEEQLYLQLYEDLLDLLPGLDGFLVAHFDEQADEVSFPFSYKHAKRVHIPPRRGGNSIAEYVIHNKKPLLLPSGDKIFRRQHGLDSPHISLGYSKSEMIIPMLLDGGKVFGAVFVSTEDPNTHYTDEHLQVLTIYTSQATLAIRNFIQINEAIQLRDATATLASQHGRENILRAIVEGAHKIVDSDFTGLILMEDDGTLKKASPVIPEKFFSLFGEPRQYGGLTREVVENRYPLNIPNTSSYPHVKDSVRDAGIKSMLIFPLIHRDRVLGVLYTHTFNARDFVARDVALWSAYTTQAAGALDRVIEEERRIRNYQRLVVGLGHLEDQLSLKETLVRIATTARSVFDSDTCRLFFIDPLAGKVVDSAWAEDDRAEYRLEKAPRPNGSTQHVLRTKKPYYFPDMTNGPRPKKALLAAGLKSAAILPLRYDGRDIGVLHCNNFYKKSTYDEHYKTLLEAFGARAAVVLNRATRKDKSDIWQGFDREIINCNETRQLYDLFTRRAHKALGADFSVFYPYNPISLDANRLPLDEECVVVGKLRSAWRQPQGGRGGGVFVEISKRKSVLIVNQLGKSSGRFSSNLVHREGVRAFVAMRLEVILPGTEEPNLAGILFLNYRQPAFLRETDLADLHSASELIAAGILRLSLEADLQRSYKQRNNQLRAVIEIFRTHELKSKDLNLDHIAEHAARSLELDVCTILEYDSIHQKFSGRGNYGLLHPEYIDVTIRSRFGDKYINSEGPIVIADVHKDRLMKSSKFVQREGIQSTVVYPLRAEGESLGLIFGNYRKSNTPSKEDIESFGLFADVAAHVLHQANLVSKINEGQLKEERRRLLVWVSMVEDMWQHTLVQKATTIRYHVQMVKRWLERGQQMPESMPSVDKVIIEIDRLAADIANAPPRVPHDSEMKSELIPIGPLLQEIVERERQSMRLRNDTQHNIDVNMRGLGGVQVFGYRRWLIFIFECLFNNAYAAMPKSGGQVSVLARKQRSWVEIRIKDTGKGIPRHLQDKIFKVPITGRQSHKGLGIGSLLVKTLMEEHRGTVELERPGPGDTTVLIRLPVSKQAKKV